MDRIVVVLEEIGTGVIVVEAGGWHCCIDCIMRLPLPWLPREHTFWPHLKHVQRLVVRSTAYQLVWTLPKLCPRLVRIHTSPSLGACPVVSVLPYRLIGGLDAPLVSRIPRLEYAQELVWR